MTTITAEQAKAEAMASAEAGADAQWQEAVMEIIKEICRLLGFGETFTTDLVHDGMKEVFPEITTHEPRALGPMMARAAKLGWITKTDQYEQSERPECHARPLRVWKICTFSV